MQLSEDMTAGESHGQKAAFSRDQQRAGKVPTAARIYQGVGALPEVFKDFAIKTFLLLYYNQVLGLPALYVSAALFVALLVGCSVALIIQGMLLVGLRFLDLLPPNGSETLLMLLVVDASIRALLATVAVVMFISMVADTLDVQDLNTGRRQEGVFNSAITFSAKATSGVGLLVAGALLDTVINFPQGARDGVAEDVIFRLGVVDGFVVPLANVVWMTLALRCRITREEHAEVRRQLDLRRAENTAQA